MFIQLQPQYLTIWELELELFAIEHRIILVDNTMVIGTDDNEVRGVVVLRTGEVVDVVGCEQRAHRHRKGHPVIEQRPVHRLLQYESIVVIHQSYILCFAYFLPSSCPIERLSNAYSTFIYVLATTFERQRNDSATIRLGHASNAPVCLTCICFVRHLVSLCFLLC